MTELEKLIALTEIHALKARYLRSVDTKDWAGLEAVFAADLVADFRESAGGFDDSLLIYGAAAFVAKLAPVLQDVVTVHHGHMPEIAIESPASASGIWSMEDMLWVREGSSLPFRWLHGYGHYHERYIRLDEGWRIQKIRLSRLRVEVG